MNSVDRLALHYLAARTYGPVAELVFKLFDKVCRGGYLYYLQPDGLVMHVPIGESDEHKYAKYQMISREKARRLLEHPRHGLSSESRQPDRDQFGGAARGSNGVILSFSGLPENIDEAYALALMVGMEWLTYEQALNLLKQSPIANVEAFKDIHDIIVMTAVGGRVML